MAHVEHGAALVMRERGNLWAAALLFSLALVAALDLSQPSEVVYSILYVVPIVLTIGLEQPRATYLVFVVSSVATVAAAAFDPATAHISATIVNRALALVAQVLAAAVVIQQLELGVRQKRADREQRQADQEQRQLLLQASAAAQTLNEQIAHDMDLLRETERQKDEFVSIVAHELRAPLTTLRGYVQLAQAGTRDLQTTQVTGSIAKALRQVDRLDRQIGELLEVSRLQVGRIELQAIPLDLEALVRDAIEQTRATAPGRRIEFSVVGTPPPLFVDPRRIEQVLTNVLDNAVKYSPDGGEIVVTLSLIDEGVQLSVQDHGVGIPEGEQARLFQRFYRARSGAKRFSGLGVGLYLCDQIVQAHKGRMWVRSVEGQGSTFGFTLPITQQFRLPR